MSYRATGDPNGACDRHPQTPATAGRCGLCNARVCIDCVDVALVALFCRSCARTERQRRARRRRRALGLGAAAILVAATVWLLSISLPLSPPARCMCDWGEAPCSELVAVCYLNQSG